jgi:hypothetical protein
MPECDLDEVEEKVCEDPPFPPMDCVPNGDKLLTFEICMNYGSNVPI